MPWVHIYGFVRKRWYKLDQSSQLGELAKRMQQVLRRTWHYGLTAFGGPPVHFQTFYKDFVLAKEDPWLDEQTYQELFALCQGLPGPASTKFIFIVVLLRFGLACAGLAFLLWAAPGAAGMFSLSLGVQHMSEILPDPVYALLSGLNASTVGVVAEAAVQLSEKCIKDRVSRILVLLGACAGLCYSALWYFPLLVTIGGISTAIWDLWLGKKIRRYKQEKARKRQAQVDAVNIELQGGYEMREITGTDQIRDERQAPDTRPAQSTSNSRAIGSIHQRSATFEIELESSARQVVTETTPWPRASQHREMQHQPESTPVVAKFGVSVKTGIFLLVSFLVSFVTLMVVRSQIHPESLLLPLFANMYLAGTIIIGGGPVVIPLLREYVVTPGWVSPRDFLIGLAMIQAFPGPNFNFAVYLGALSLARAGSHRVEFSFLGAILGFIGIFAPGMLLAVCIQAFWRRLRTVPFFTALLRGVNATAVGLIYTAVYRLWEVGYLSKTSTNGKSLAQEPWWVAVSVVAFASSKWFGVPAVGCILAGAILGLAWWGATQT